jgi:general nucleoside transport system permease protein
MKELLQERQHLFSPLISILLAFLLGAILILLNGDSPLKAYQAMLATSIGSLERLAITLAVATPLILTGLGAAVAFKAGVFNIGLEGQLYLGAFAGALVGLSIKGLWAPLHVGLAVAAGILAGGLWAWLFGWLKVKWNVNEVVSTIMSNYVAILFTSYLANYPFKPPTAAIGSTDYILPSAELPQVFSFATLNAGFFIALVAVILYWFVFRYTTIGYEWKTVGLNALFARYIGMKANRQILLVMFVSGALAGLAGAIEVLGVQRRFVQNMSPGYGYDGILVALLANNSGPGALAVAILFGILRVGGIGVEQDTNVPSELSQVLQAAIILLLAAQIGLARFAAWRQGA